MRLITCTSTFVSILAVVCGLSTPASAQATPPTAATCPAHYQMSGVFCTKPSNGDIVLVSAPATPGMVCMKDYVVLAGNLCVHPAYGDVSFATPAAGSTVQAAVQK